MAKATRLEDAPRNRRWDVAGEPYITLVLDKNEALAVRAATREYYAKSIATDSHPTSLNGAGARVYASLKAAIGRDVV